MILTRKDDKDYTYGIYKFFYYHWVFITDIKEMIVYIDLNESVRNWREQTRPVDRIKIKY